MIFNMIANGGGASTPRFGIATGTPTSTENTSLSFTNLLGEPQAFCAILVPKGVKNQTKLELSTFTSCITHFVYDGVEISTAVTMNNSSVYYSYVHGNGYNAEKNSYSFVYSNGTLTLRKHSEFLVDGSFYVSDINQYELLYIY